MDQATTNVDPATEASDVAGIYLGLGRLSATTPITEDGLAHLMGKACRETIKRAVERGELPPPVRLMGKNTWLVGSITRHLEDKLQEQARKFQRQRPQHANYR